MAEGVAEAIDAFGELGVSDTVAATFDGDAVGAVFAKMAIDEVVRGVEARLILSVGGGHGEKV